MRNIRGACANLLALSLTLSCSSQSRLEITPQVQVVLEPVSDPVRELCTDDSSHRTEYINVPFVRFIGSTIELNGVQSSERELLGWAQKKYPKIAEQTLWVQLSPEDRPTAERALLPIVRWFPQLRLRQVDAGFSCHLLASPRWHAACVLQEGLGADFGRIGVTTEKTVGSVPPSVKALYERGVLSEILVLGGDCRTLKGIGIGDDRRNVERLYGESKKTDVYLEKGTGDRLGKLGDYVLEYPGVAFVIDHDKVAALFIPANRTDCSCLKSIGEISPFALKFPSDQELDRNREHVGRNVQ